MLPRKSHRVSLKRASRQARNFYVLVVWDRLCSLSLVMHASVYQDFAQRRSQSAPLSVTYGSTELVNAEGFFEQLMDLGQKQG